MDTTYGCNRRDGNGMTLNNVSSPWKSPWVKGAALFAGAVFLLCIAVGGWLVYRSSEERKGFFRTLDLNADGYVTLQEWMAYYGPHEHPWRECAGKDFEPADCNHDQRLSWSEHKAARFDWNYCGRSPEIFTEWEYKKPIWNSRTGAYTLRRLYGSPLDHPSRTPSDRRARGICRNRGLKAKTRV
jgi:hypothetical protein